MLTYFSNNTAVYRVHNPVDTSHSYISFLSTKTYYNSLLFPDIRHAYISPRPTDTSHICLSLSHILHVYVTLYRHTLPQYFSMSSRAISYLPSTLSNRSILPMSFTLSSSRYNNFLHSVQNTHLTNNLYTFLCLPLCLANISHTFPQLSSSRVFQLNFIFIKVY